MATEDGGFTIRSSVALTKQVVRKYRGGNKVNFIALVNPPLPTLSPQNWVEMELRKGTFLKS